VSSRKSPPRAALARAPHEPPHEASPREEACSRARSRGALLVSSRASLVSRPPHEAAHQGVLVSCLVSRTPREGARQDARVRLRTHQSASADAERCRTAAGNIPTGEGRHRLHPLLHPRFTAAHSPSNLTSSRWHALSSLLSSRSAHTLARSIWTRRAPPRRDPMGLSKEAPLCHHPRLCMARRASRRPRARRASSRGRS